MHMFFVQGFMGTDENWWRIQPPSQRYETIDSIDLYLRYVNKQTNQHRFQSLWPQGTPRDVTWLKEKRNWCTWADLTPTVFLDYVPLELTMWKSSAGLIMLQNWHCQANFSAVLPLRTPMCYWENKWTWENLDTRATLLHFDLWFPLLQHRKRCRQVITTLGL